MLATIANAALFQAAWFGCVWGAAQSRPVVAAAGSTLAVAWYLARSPRRLRALTLLAAGAGLGLFVDTLLLRAGLLAFPTEPEASRSPPWMVGLWAAFATTVGESLAWLSRRAVPAAVLGAIAGPASYAAGARLGAIDLSSEPILAAVWIGVAWALALPALGALAHQLVRSDELARDHATAHGRPAQRERRESIGLG